MYAVGGVSGSPCSTLSMAVAMDDWTVRTQEADTLLPSAAVAVMVLEPGVKAVTNPLVLTVATLVLELFHVTFLFAALEGATVAVN